MVHTRREIGQLLERHGRSPRRSLGQNFVADPNTVRRIARLAAVGPGDDVVEIGPGLGSLTLALAETGATVTAVEVDAGMLPALAEATAGTDVRVVHADAMSAVWDDLIDPARRWTLVANLPYNIATPLLCDLLDTVPQIVRMFVMVQREVGERLAARPGSRMYGAVSVKVGYWATARIAGLVPPTVFVPQPKVDSALVEITRRDQPATTAPAADVFELVRVAFGQRRKMLRGSLRGLVDDAVFAAAGVAGTQRPEELDVAAWGRLAEQWRAAGVHADAMNADEGSG